MVIAKVQLKIWKVHHRLRLFLGQRLKYFDLEAGYSYDIETDTIHEYSSTVNYQSFVNSHTAYLYLKPKIPYYGGYIFGVLGASYSQVSLNVKDFLDAEITGDTTSYVRENMKNKGSAIYYDIGLGYEHIIPIPEVASINNVSVVFQYTYSILGYKKYNVDSTYTANLELEGVDPAFSDALQSKSSLVVAFKVSLD